MTDGPDSNQNTPNNDGNQPQTPGVDPNQGQQNEPDWRSEADKWREFSRKWEERAKENYEAAQKLKEMEDAQRSDVDKLTEKVTEAERRAAEAEKRALLREVAFNKRVPDDLVDRLRGDTKEELEADAEKLMRNFGSAVNQTTPKEDLRGGNTPKDEPPKEDPAKIAEQVWRSTRMF